MAEGPARIIRSAEEFGMVRKVAREYGIPAVLGTKIGTHHFKNGEMLIVDGTKGKVVKISKRCSLIK